MNDYDEGKQSFFLVGIKTHEVNSLLFYNVYKVKDWIIKVVRKLINPLAAIEPTWVRPDFSLSDMTYAREGGINSAKPISNAFPDEFLTLFLFSMHANF